MRPLRAVLLLAAPLALVSGSPALAAPPSPLAPALFAFPGSVAAPGSAASAGLGLADRWLGEEPFANPAVPSGFRLVASPMLLRMSRQDLRADNRNYDETGAFFDGAGFAVGLPALGPLAAAVYAFQPVLRLEENAFLRGTGTPDPANPPAVVQSRSSAREARAGLALASGLAGVRFGVGVEWTHREDDYQSVERSGAPEAGTRRVEFSGDGLSLQAGARLDRGDSAAGGLALGLGMRYLPALAVQGVRFEDLTFAGSSEETLRAEREAGWEAGVSARIAVSPAFRVLAAVGGRTAQGWDGFDLRAGSGWEWKLAGEFHDVRDPWALRFGVGQERQSDVPEPRAGVIGLGFGWRFPAAIVDLGVVRRTVTREQSPRSFDDRLVVSLRIPR